MPTFESYLLFENNSLLEVPIYRSSTNQFEDELDKRVADWTSLNPVSADEEYFGKEVAEQKFEARRQWYKTHIGYPWKYNEIIGYILLNIDGETLSGELFMNNKKRIVQNTKGKILYKNTAFKFEVTEEMTDFIIYNTILKELKSLIKKPFLKGRYVDTHRFETIGRYIKWQDMFEDLKS